MEDFKLHYRHSYWKYELSPFKKHSSSSSSVPVPNQSHADLHDDVVIINNNNNSLNNAEGIGENLHVDASAPPGHDPIVKGEAVEQKWRLCCRRWHCVWERRGQLQVCFVGCKLKAMALTTFCHLHHILSDSKQKLYEACVFVIKSALAGPILCSKPILRFIVPSYCALCPTLTESSGHVAKTLKKAGLNVPSSNKIAPKLHIIIDEYVRRIQAKRMTALKANTSKVVVKEEAMT